MQCFDLFQTHPQAISDVRGMSHTRKKQTISDADFDSISDLSSGNIK